ncbi:MAG TPA: uroporphyrinogen-III synthase, partial [Acidimicrobiales bacterium]|nr:uroporphyrinogen-III synthase [Acidimicrobiales bacterium]
TSAVAAPAYAGIPVTHRGLSAAFTVVTGHSGTAEEPEADWGALARSSATLVLLMAVAHRGRIAERLMAAGLAPDTPVAAVEWGTRPDQKVVRTTLAGLGEAPVSPPSTIVIGAVAGLDLSWWRPGPLAGRRVVVTRATGQAGRLSGLLRTAGATVVEVPAIALVDPPDGGAELRRVAGLLRSGPPWEWLAVTSVNAVDRLLDACNDSRDLAGVRVAAVGPGTAGALAQRGIAADLVPPRSSGEDLAIAMPPAHGGAKVLMVRAAEAEPALPRLLAEAGWDVEEVAAYRTVPAELSERQLAEVAGADAVTFASGSAIRALVGAAGTGGLPPVVVCIGPRTAEIARRSGLAVSAVAADQTLESLVATVVDALGTAGGPAGQPGDRPPGQPGARPPYQPAPSSDADQSRRHTRMLSSRDAQTDIAHRDSSSSVDDTSSSVDEGPTPGGPGTPASRTRSAPPATIHPADG